MTYLAMLSNQQIRVGKALITLGELLQSEFRDDDADQVYKARDLLLDIQGICKEAQDLIPLPKYRKGHTKYMRALEQCNKVCLLLHKGLSEPNIECLARVDKEFKLVLPYFIKFWGDLAKWLE